MARQKKKGEMALPMSTPTSTSIGARTSCLILARTTLPNKVKRAYCTIQCGARLASSTCIIHSGVIHSKAFSMSVSMTASSPVLPPSCLVLFFGSSSSQFCIARKLPCGSLNELSKACEGCRMDAAREAMLPKTVAAMIRQAQGGMPNGLQLSACCPTSALGIQTSNCWGFLT